VDGSNVTARPVASTAAQNVVLGQDTAFSSFEMTKEPFSLSQEKVPVNGQPEVSGSTRTGAA
jgi:hypothetical protein